jgi:hypothetical protein
MMDAMCSSETSLLTRATRPDIPEDDIIYIEVNSLQKTEDFWAFDVLLLEMSRDLWKHFPETG